MMNDVDISSDGVGSNSKRDTFLPQVEDVSYQNNDTAVAKERLFDTLAVEIGDEVTVPSTTSPLTFHSITDSDHSYISAPRFLETPSAGQLRFPDCNLIGETTLLEFQDLFDFNVFCQPFDLANSGGAEQPVGVELQEQIIENCSSTLDSESFRKMAQDWMQMHDGETTDSKESDGDSDGGNSIDDEEDERFTCENQGTAVIRNKNGYRRKNCGHHTGPLPQTFILEPWDRRARFCFSLQTIVNKIKNLMTRTGGKADFRTEFENHIFTLDNVETLLRFTDRNKSKASSSVKSGKDNSVLSNDPDGDHLYAATILTQTETSGVKDHQYNEVSTSENLNRTVSRTIQKSFIRTRYARERFLKKTTATIFSKLQRLVNRTGAKMNLAIEYENITINHRNYTDIDKLLGRTRTLKSVRNKHAPLLGQTENGPESILSSDDGTGAVSYSFDAISIPESPPARHQDFYPNAVESDHDYDTHSNRRMSSDRKCPVVTEIFFRPDDASSGSRIENSVLTIPQNTSTASTSEPIGPSCKTAHVAESEHHSSDNVTGSFRESIETIALSITNPRCQECGQTERNSTSIEIGKHPPWIRCANPLCQYLVHPGCIGFFILNTQNLQYLPPYYCPSHRD